MVTGSGQAPGPSVLLTREVRWFIDGRLPGPVLDWFTDGTEFGVERRIDHYDLDAARRNIGIKRRSTTSMDSKFRVLLLENVALGRGLSGHVEDWMKISEPLGNGVSTDVTHPVEMVSIDAGPVQAWSLCFESYGPPDQRGRAFRAGIDRLLAETPLPSGRSLGPESCHGYPEWISSLALETA
jgi:hypothetical protein